MKLSEYRRRLDPHLAELRHTERQIKEETAKLADARWSHETICESRSLLQQLAENAQRSAHEQITQIVSKCLETVFEDEAYEFRIRFERKRGKTEAILEFVRDGNVIDPMSAAGGGAVDVAAFGLRLAALVLVRPQPRPLLVLDEPFRFVSRDYAPRVRDLLLALARDLNVQIIMVTHDSRLVAGKVVELG